ncbi:hypothetical protein EV384_0956 [Micromonospora kangleipakensis]|uniref:Uncharacterized protein n=1 Tax=Micromonospora kangleipakensis TaxID=1077942 RepID=A0A4Q8B6C2_9ACTN|nr:hypothetical protein [Micromonospora kangleipakensis]RZU72585.1 hypothetical protein EV384_0956 [Micromonospora kangleipakensis]
MIPPDAAPVRPAIVTAAFWVQLATVVVLLLLVGLVVVQAVRYDGQIDRALGLVPDADPVEVSDERSGNVFTALAMGVPALLLAGWLAATARPLSRGSNTARVLVFVAAGAQLLLCLFQGCSGVLFIPLVLAAGAADPGFDPSEGVPPDGPDWEQSKFLDTLYAQGNPADVFFGVGGLGVLAVLVLTTVVVVLLLLPEAGRWFRPPPAVPAGAHPMASSSGYPPVGVTFPPGYMICPDPALHLAHPPTGSIASTSHGPAEGRPTAAGDRTPEGPQEPPADPTADTLRS